MRLHCLGTAGYHPNEVRHTSCYSVPDASLLLDAGTGAFRVREQIVGKELDILLSHAHLDHVIGLTFFLDVVATTPLERIRVHGEASKLEAIREHLFSPLIFPILPPIDWVPLPNPNCPFAIGRAKVTWFPLVHPGQSVGYRIDWPGHSFAYVTDTHSQLDSPYWKSIEGCDVLLHECNFLDEQVEFALNTGHSCPSVVIEGAKRSNVGRLYLTHLDPLQDEAIKRQVASLQHKASPLKVACVQDLMQIPLGSGSD